MSQTVEQLAVDFRCFDEKMQKNLGIYNPEDPDNPRTEEYAQRVRHEQLGVGCKSLIEPVPVFQRAECEEVLGKSGRKKNAYIVLGRDRHGSFSTGFGGAGETQAGMIDIVVGRGGSSPGCVSPIHPSFVGQNSDCARIYISQKAKIDQYFNLIGGNVGSADGTSAIAMKADDIRILSRQGVKIVTGVDSHNSRDVELASTYGIDLIAGNNDEDLESLVRGESLVECLTRIINEIDALNGVVNQLSKVVQKINSGVQTHTHISPFGGIPVPPSPTYMSTGIVQAVRNNGAVQSSLETQKQNLMALSTNYLGINGEGTYGAPKCILSRFNKTN